MKQKGFTLIELLVVIAIIGILSSVVLASLNSARAKGADAAVKAALANARAQAELFADGNPTGYTGVCANSTTGIGAMVAQASTTGAGAACFDDANSWSASAGLRGQSGTFWCVGSSGVAKATSSQVTTATSCQ